MRPAYLRPHRAAFFTAPREAVAANLAREMLTHDIAHPEGVVGLTRGPRTRACDWFTPELPAGTRPPSAAEHLSNSRELWHILAMFPRGYAAFCSGAHFPRPRRIAPPTCPSDVSDYTPITALAALT